MQTKSGVILSELQKKKVPKNDLEMFSNSAFLRFSSFFLYMMQFLRI